jgi:hypothetical protein
MSNLYRGPSIDASYQVSVHFVNINKDENKSLISNQFSLKKDL